MVSILNVPGGSSKIRAKKNPLVLAKRRPLVTL